jgi:hypothetical protein
VIPVLDVDTEGVADWPAALGQAFLTAGSHPDRKRRG